MPVLTLEQAVELALANDPRLAAAEAAVEAAKGNQKAAGAPPNPDLDLTPVTSNRRSADLQFGLTQIFEISGRRSIRRRAAAAVLDHTQQHGEAVRRQITAQVREAYFHVLEVDAHVQAVQETIALVARLQGLAQERLDAGDVPRADLVRAQFELTKAQQELPPTQAEAESARAALNVLLGRDAHAPLTLAGSLTLAEEIPTRDELHTRAMDSPRLRQAEADVRIAQTEVAAAHTARRPDLAATLFREGEEKEFGLLARVEFPLLDRGRIRGRVQQAQAQVRQAAAERDQTRRAVALAIEQAVAEWEAARARATAYRGDLLRQAEELVQMAELGYREGQMGLLEVLDAQRQLTETWLASIERQSELIAAQTRLELAVSGLLTPPEMEQGEAETQGPTRVPVEAATSEIP
jgi:cobalt-zinc-cadmium efflux system outer membrane protein